MVDAIASIAPEAAAKGAEALAPAAEALGPSAEALGGAPLNIVPDVGSFAPSAVGDIVGATGLADVASLTAPSAVDAAGPALATVGADAAGPLTTADASLFTGSAPTATGATPGVGSPSIAELTAQPTAAPGTFSPASGAGGGAAAAPPSGIGAGSITPPAGTPVSPDATSSWGDMLKKGLTSNPLGAGIAAAGLGYNILSGQKQTANNAALTGAAQQATANNTRLTDAGIAQVGTNQTNAADIGNRGKDLEQYLSTGRLPDQYSQQVETAINDAKTTAISNAAKNGQPTDPTKNTSLAQQLAQIDSQRSAMTSKVAETLFSAGAGLTNTAAGIGNASAGSLLSGGQNAAGLSGQLYTTLTNIDTQQSKQTADAIAALARSLNTGGQTNTTQKATA